MTLALHLYRRRNSRSVRYPAEGKPPCYDAVEALRLALALQSRFPGSIVYAVGVDPPATYDASELAQIAEEQSATIQTP